MAALLDVGIPPPECLHCCPSLPGQPTGLSCSGAVPGTLLGLLFPSVFIQCLRNPLHVI